jgi:hypothetical protein
MLAATEKTTVPFPLPLVLKGIVIQLTSLIAFQLQLDEAVTLRAPLEMVIGTDAPLGEIEMVQTDTVAVALLPAPSALLPMTE